MKRVRNNIFGDLPKKQHPFRAFYPLGWWVWKKLCGRNKEYIQRKKQELRVLYVKEDINQSFAIYQAKKMSILIVMILVISFMGMVLTISSNKKSQLIDDKYIARPEYGEYEKNIDLHVIVNKEGSYFEQDLTIEVGPRKYTLEEFELAVKQAEEYLEQVVKGENSSYEGIYYKLNLPSSIPNSGLSVTWTLDDYELIESGGTIRKEQIKDPIVVTIMAKIKADTFEAEYPMNLTLLPIILSEEEQIYYGLVDAIKGQEELSSTEKQMELPTELGEMKVSFIENKAGKVKIVVFLGLLASIIVYFGMDKKLKEKREQRDEQSMLDYPEIINKFTLLLGAGMTMKRAWEKIVFDYEKAVYQQKKEKRYAYDELSLTLNEMKNGVNETKAYENFGRRMRLQPYMKLSSLLVQNGSKGMEGLFCALQKEAFDAFEERKEYAKRLGEKAGTKLLFPMMLMLGVVLVMVIVPAAISL